MAHGLYDIAEPGTTPMKEACRGRAVGIDLGTTNSLVAVVKEGQPICLADEAGETLLPSAVRYLPNAAPVVGAAALADAVHDPENTLLSIKRFMGRGPTDAETRGQFVPYRFATQTGPVVKFAVAGDREVTPVEVSAEILRTLRLRAEHALGGPLEGAVITVPAYFDDAQRQATKDAGRIAGLKVLRLVNEPTAAALAYGLDKKSEGLFAVYDLGGGTFDISILKLAGGVFEVKSTGGDTALGGDDFDRALAEAAARKLGVDLSHHLSAEQGRELLQTARAVKHQLTDHPSATFAYQGQRTEMTREEFEQAIEPILIRTSGTCRQALRDAQIQAADLSGVILVGGATRTPAVKRYVKKIFGQEPLGDIDPDQVVAVGAAIQADVLTGTSESDILLLDVIPLSLGLELMGGVVEKIIHRNSTVPAGAQQVFTTYADRQTGFDLHVVQGERETASECRSLARFQLKGIPPMAAGMARLEVTFLVDVDGLLRVSARELTTGTEAAVEVKPTYGLSDEQIEQMLVDSYEHAEDDLKQRMLAEARTEAERIVNALQIALKADGELLSASERTVVDQAVSNLTTALSQTDHTAIRRLTDALDLATKPFAERRMNRSMQEAISGKDVLEVEKKVEHAKGVEEHSR